jgi:hypothetical protein
MTHCHPPRPFRAALLGLALLAASVAWAGDTQDEAARRAEAAAARAEAAAARSEAGAARTEQAIERLERLIDEFVRREAARAPR